MDSPEVVAAMRRSEVFILASAFEGFCISLIESMANGCTPIVTDIRSGNKQLVADGVSGFIVPVGDVDGFVDRIRLLAGDRGRLRDMRVAAWETGRDYSIDRMVDNYERCFERAIEDTRSNPRKIDTAFPLMDSCRSKYPLWLRRIKARVSGF
jgi:glycosyltransferase involved in cell wall biosynthesis